MNYDGRDQVIDIKNSKYQNKLLNRYISKEVKVKWLFEIFPLMLFVGGKKKILVFKRARVAGNKKKYQK